MLTSLSRGTLGLLQYDIAAALQSIVIELLEAKKGTEYVKLNYPAHYELVLNRKAFRAKISDETGKELKWVKKRLTSIDNGGSVANGYLDRSPSLTAYKNEAYSFAMDYLDSIPKEQLIRAQRLTWVPKNLDEYWVKNDIAKGKRFEDGRKKFGVFFHAWAQTERIIRELMKQHFKGYCHDVHDAVATKEVVDVGLINQELIDAGFRYVRVEV